MNLVENQWTIEKFQNYCINIQYDTFQNHDEPLRPNKIYKKIKINL